MIEENKGTGTEDGGSQPEMVEVPKAVFEELQASKKFKDDVDERATDMGMEGKGLEYVDTLETLAHKNVVEELDEPEKKVESKVEPKAEPKEEKGLSDADQERLKQSSMQSAQAQLTSNWTEFRMEQLSATEKSPFTKDDLFKVIQKQGALVGATARNFNGNVFAAANHILTVTDPDAVAKARQSTEDSEAAKKRAASSTDLPDGKTAPAAETTEAEKVEKALQAERDLIFPDDPQPQIE